MISVKLRHPVEPTSCCVPCFMRQLQFFYIARDPRSRGIHHHSGLRLDTAYGRQRRSARLLGVSKCNAIVPTPMRTSSVQSMAPKKAQFTNSGPHSLASSKALCETFLGIRCGCDRALSRCLRRQETPCVALPTLPTLYLPGSKQEPCCSVHHGQHSPKPYHCEPGAR